MKGSKFSGLLLCLLCVVLLTACGEQAAEEPVTTQPISVTTPSRAEPENLMQEEQLPDITIPQQIEQATEQPTEGSTEPAPESKPTQATEPVAPTTPPKETRPPEVSQPSQPAQPAVTEPEVTTQPTEPETTPETTPPETTEQIEPPDWMRTSCLPFPYGESR